MKENGNELQHIIKKVQEKAAMAEANNEADRDASAGINKMNQNEDSAAIMTAFLAEEDLNPGDVIEEDIYYYYYYYDDESDKARDGNKCPDSIPFDNDDVRTNEMTFAVAVEMDASSMKDFIIDFSNTINSQVGNSVLRCKSTTTDTKENGIFLVRVDQIVQESLCKPTRIINSCEIIKGHISLYSDAEITKEEINRAMNTIKDSVQEKNENLQVESESVKFLGPNIPHGKEYDPNNLAWNISKVLLLPAAILILSLLLFTLHRRRRRKSWPNH